MSFMSHTEKFASMIAAELRNPEVLAVPGVAHLVRGGLDTGATVAAVEILIPWLFRDLKTTPPIVRCTEPWMKTGADWHNGDVMCWEIQERWRDEMGWKGKPVRAILTDGAHWLITSVRLLVNRHYVAHLEGLERWPEEWAYWKHGQEGVIQYRDEQRRAFALLART